MFRSPKSGRGHRGDANTFLRRYIAINLIRLFIFNSLCVMGCVYLTGLGVMHLPEAQMHYLMLQMFGQGAAVVVFIARELFKNRSAVKARRRSASG